MRSPHLTHTMATSPQIANKLFDALLFTPFHEDVIIYPDDIFIAFSC